MLQNVLCNGFALREMRDSAKPPSVVMKRCAFRRKNRGRHKGSGRGKMRATD